MQEKTTESVAPREEELMGKHPGSQGGLTENEAEKMLKRQGGHHYLTRYCKEHKCYFLSVHRERGEPSSPVLEHYRINKGSDDKITIRETGKKFGNIRLLLRHYEKHCIDHGLESIGKPIPPPNTSSVCTLL